MRRSVALVGGAQKHSAFWVVSSELGTVAMALWVGSDPVEAKNTHQNHSHEWGCQEKGLPAGLKGDTLHADPLVWSLGREMNRTPDCRRA